MAPMIPIIVSKAVVCTGSAIYSTTIIFNVTANVAISICAGGALVAGLEFVFSYLLSETVRETAKQTARVVVEEVVRPVVRKTVEIVKRCVQNVAAFFQRLWRRLFFGGVQATASA
jgi:hypothetical protein